MGRAPPISVLDTTHRKFGILLIFIPGVKGCGGPLEELGRATVDQGDRHSRNVSLLEDFSQGFHLNRVAFNDVGTRGRNFTPLLHEHLLGHILW